MSLYKEGDKVLVKDMGEGEIIGNMGGTHYLIRFDDDEGYGKTFIFDDKDILDKLHVYRTMDGDVLMFYRMLEPKEREINCLEYMGVQAENDL